MSCNFFNIHSKKDFLLTMMQKEMIKRFLIILKTFPERIIISQKNGIGDVDYSFTNDEMTEESLVKGNVEAVNECILRKNPEEDLFMEDPTIVDLQDSLQLDSFLEEERLRATDKDGEISESKILSFAAFHSDPGKMLKELKKKVEEEKGEENEQKKFSKKHYTVKTRQIEWKRNVNIDESMAKALSYLHIFIDNTSTEKLKQEKTLREYQRLMLSSVAHEFRNPLNAIKGNLQLIEMYQDPRIEKFVRISLNSCILLNSYVEDILDLGRMEGSAFQLNLDEFKMEEV